ncbi:MAG: hypothetical protein WKG00_11310 [Polyangiaceae bacterium]
MRRLWRRRRAWCFGGRERAGGSGVCAGGRLLANPEDPAARGPAAVGARTVHLPGLEQPTEVWYPAAAGAGAGVDAKVYDVRLWLPEASQGLVPDEANPGQTCDCQPDLPLDAEHGPYPVVVFLHGTAAFRTQSLSQMVHWASRGFVVVASDHAGLYLGDLLALEFGADQPADTAVLLEALASPAGDLSFLEGALDLSRVGITGHSAGGMALSSLGSIPGVRALVPMAAGGVEPGASLESVLVMGAIDDAVVDFQEQVSGYDASPTRKRLVGIANAGHLAFSDLCELKNAAGEDLLEVAQKYRVPNAQFADALWDGCADGQTPEADASRIVRHASTVVLEEALQCRPVSAGLFGLQAAEPLVGELREQLE